jgi:hypothetical protein
VKDEEVMATFIAGAAAILGGGGSAERHGERRDIAAFFSVLRHIDLS